MHLRFFHNCFNRSGTSTTDNFVLSSRAPFLLLHSGYLLRLLLLLLLVVLMLAQQK